MGPRDRFQDSLDQLITEALREQLGPPPGSEIWERVVRDIHEPVQPRRRERWFLALQAILRAPLLQSAIALTALLVLLVQPTNYLIDRVHSHEPSTATPPLVVEQEAPAPQREVSKEQQEALYRQLLALDAATHVAERPPVKVEEPFLGGIQP